jgi:hypothetical protein
MNMLLRELMLYLLRVDHYKENSIKNVTRQKRGPQTGILKVIENSDTPLPQQGHLFIHLVQYKKQLTNFFVQTLTLGGAC